MVWLLLAVVGLLFTVRLAACVTADSWLRRIVLASYLTKLFAAAALFHVSAWELPLLEGIQLGGGFWEFGRDSVEYHRLGSSIADVWTNGGSLPTMGPEVGISMYVGAVYWLFGVHPLNVAVLNAWYGAFTVVGAVWIGRRFVSSAFSSRMTATLIGFWPSGILWSTQMMKDSMSAALLVGLMVFMGMAIDRRRVRVTGAALGSAATLLFALYFIRDYFAGALVAAVLVAFVPWVALRLVRREWPAGARMVVLCAALAATLGVASQVDLAAYGRQPTGWTYAVDTWSASTEGAAPSPAGGVAAAGRALAVRFQTLPRYLGLLRSGMMREPGRSVLDPDVTVATWPELWRYLPRGLAVVFLSPFPWQWLFGGTTVLLMFAGFETLLIYALLPCAAVGLYRLAGRVDPVLVAAVFAVAVLAVGFAIVVPVVGTLFRLRLQLVIAMLVVVGSMDAFAAVYGRIFAFARRQMEVVPEC